jgi:hypothetical protein
MPTLAALIGENEAERVRLGADPARAALLARLQDWQRARLAHTYADLAAAPRYAAAVAFFLGELYGGANAAPRDRDLKRAAGALERLLPAKALGVLKQAIALEIATRRLDVALAAQLPSDAPLTAATYAAAYRSSAPRAAREAQLASILEIGAVLDRLVRHASLGVLLKLGRGPAHAAGLGALQDFLERGVAAFRATGGAGEFLAVIREREARLLERMYAAEAEPCPESTDDGQ